MNGRKLLIGDTVDSISYVLNGSVTTISDFFYAILCGKNDGGHQARK